MHLSLLFNLPREFIDFRRLHDIRNRKGFKNVVCETFFRKLFIDIFYNLIMKNLSPSIYRQRVIIEGTCKDKITAIQIKKYLTKLSLELGMKTLLPPVTHLSEQYGWAGWIHWDSSGCHFYAWDKPFSFFSADVYTCKRFDTQKAVAFTKKFFNTIEISFKEV